MLHRADKRRRDKRREPLSAGKVYHRQSWRGYQTVRSRCITDVYSSGISSGRNYSRIKAWRLVPLRRFTPSRSAGRGNDYSGLCWNINTLSEILFLLSMTSYFRGFACFDVQTPIPLTVTTSLEGSRMAQWEVFQFQRVKHGRDILLRIAPVSSKKNCQRNAELITN